MPILQEEQADKMKMRSLATSGCLAIFLMLASVSGLSQKEPASVPMIKIDEAARLVNLTPQSSVQHDYVVTAAVRLLLFWISRDDVGQGYIRLGVQPGETPLETIHLVMGSDPAKAPLGVNRWGAAAEVWSRTDSSGAFFGFMKAPKEESVSAARDELSREKESQRYQFEGIISRISNGQETSITVPINSAKDFTLHQLPLAQQMVMERLKTTTRTPRALDARSLQGCATGSGFLFTLRELMTAALSGQKTPLTRCYIYFARRYTMTMNRCEPVKEMKVALKLRGATRKVEKIYRDLRKADFRIVNAQTGLPTDFQMVFGESGGLKGVPVQVEFQPNWWFRVTINLKPDAPGR
jgi:hypothetical protein